MATFLVRAFELVAAEPAGFADTTDNFHAPDIDALAAASVTAGCSTGPLLYCPNNPVTRAQMATFLNRALGRSQTPEPTESVSMDLSGVCPSPLVMQTDWFPESEQGALYHLIGDDYTVDTLNKVVQGPMVLDGVDLGIEFQIRTGGPAIGFASVPSHMYRDRSIHLGHTSTDSQMQDWADAPVVSVVAPLEKSPWMIMWDPQTYPDVHSIADLGREGVTVNVFAGGVFPLVLVAQGTLSAEQVDPTYDGSPARFISAGGTIAQQGLASQEVYTYEHVHQQWGRAVAFQLLHDAGFEAYTQTIAVRPSDLESLRPCLEKIVPVIQQAVVSFAESPDQAMATIVDAVERFQDFWSYPPDLAAFSAWAQREYGIVGNGPDSTVGNFDARRINRVLNSLLLTDLSDALPLFRVEDLFTNDFIDDTIGF